MTTILIYDSDAKEISDICNANGISPAELIEEFVENFLQGVEDAKHS